MRLTKTQVEHATARLGAALNQKLDALKARLGERPAALPALTEHDKYNLIVEGKATLLPKRNVRGYTALYEAYTYPEDPKAAERNAKAIKAWDDAFEKQAAPLRAQYAEVLDNIILSGNGDEALRLISEFAKK